MRKLTLRLTLMTVVAMVTIACSRQTSNLEPSQTMPAEQLATSTTPATSPTAVPTAAPTASALPTSIPTVALATPVPTATLDALQGKLPRDEKGRIIGGPNAPVINYSPTMITGKPCPRVTKWTFQVIRPDGLQPYGIADDPCVVQNAVDDYMRTRFALPAFNKPESIKEIAPLYDTDPALLNGLSDVLGMRKGLIQAYRDGSAVYNLCDKATYFLLNVDAKAPLPAENDGKSVTGKTIQITLLRVAKDVEPFSCKLISYKDGTTQSTYSLTTDDMKTKGGSASVNYLMWNPRTTHWELFGFRSIAFKDYYPTAKALWEALSAKP